VPVPGPSLLPSALVTGTINIAAALLVFHALRRTDLSLAVPVITFTLVFLMGTSFLVLGEVPTAAGVAGILLIVSGSVVMNIPPGGANPPPAAGTPVLIRAVRRMAGDRGILAMLLVAFLYSLSLPYDKAVVLASDPVFGSALVDLYIGGAFAILVLARRGNGTAPTGAALAAVLALGLVLAGETVAINLAYTLQIVPYVIAVKRLSILFSVLIGGLFFREKGLRWRIPGALAMIGGVALIVLAAAPGPIPS
jgi:drug/metabolite transporter (DMT)-like permease